MIYNFTGFTNYKKDFYCFFSIILYFFEDDRFAFEYLRIIYILIEQRMDTDFYYIEYKYFNDICKYYVELIQYGIEVDKILFHPIVKWIITNIELDEKIMQNTFPHFYDFYYTRTKNINKVVPITSDVVKYVLWPYIRKLNI